MTISRGDVPGVFLVDGSWRDVYVRATSAADWNSMLVWLRRDYPNHLQFQINGEDAPMPEMVEDTLRMREVGSPMLQLNLDGLLLNCHFFTDVEIEFDIDPSELTEMRLKSLLKFLRSLGQLLRHNVYVCPENCLKAPLLVYEHEIDRMVAVSACDRDEWES